MATIATHSGNVVALGHNQRRPEYVAGESHIRADGHHVCWEAKKWDLVSETSEMWTDEAEIYGRVFGRACADYAEKCKERGHPERAKTPQDVLDAQKRAGRPAIRELVCGVYPADGEEISEQESERILIDFAGRFMDKFPSMPVLGLYFHADEQGKAPHVHIDYVPVAKRKSRGLSVSPSMSGALRDMGYSDKVNGKTVRAHALTSWTADVNKLLEDVCAEHGVTVTHPDRDKDVQHLDTAAYKAVQDAKRDAETKAQAIKAEADAQAAAVTQAAQEAAEEKAREIEAEAEKKAAKRLLEAESQRKMALSDAAKAKAEAKQAREDAETARKAADEAKAEAAQAYEDAEKAKRAKRKAKSERDSAASQLKDIRGYVEALGPDGYGLDWGDGRHEPSLREVRERVADARDELHGVYRDIDQAREDLEVTTGRRTLGLRDVVASVIGVIAETVDGWGFSEVAAWLRERADRLTARVIDRLAPETVRAHRAFATGGPDDDAHKDASDDRSLSF